MIVAVSYFNGSIFQHFGKTPSFMIFEIEDGSIVSNTLVDCNGTGHEALVGLLMNHHVDSLICGGIGSGAFSVLRSSGISVYAGNTGSPEDAVHSLLSGSLSSSDSSSCSHHGHDHSCESRPLSGFSDVPFLPRY